MRSHINRPGFVVIVAIQRDFIIRFVIEKPSKCELKEAVMEGLAIDELIAKGIVSIAGAVTQLIRIDGIEVRRVRRVNDFRLERRRLTSQLLRPIDLVEERMVLNLINVLSDPLIFTLA